MSWTSLQYQDALNDAQSTIEDAQKRIKLLENTLLELAEIIEDMPCKCSSSFFRNAYGPVGCDKHKLEILLDNVSPL